ncbi:MULTISPECIES: GNAT family N-acetyltransferase [Bradyrhizobium]|uniref:Uncharacterized protein n=1 Tax=Bradyrhizobium septentrionale TaxID=1404411 RepID=A0A974A5A8_9BRAD|nr:MULTISPECIES: GNAT family N-acetyltransferase [Bradyrhizobium]MCK7667478.1 hypothetical protein [Bradyrhizobium sp. 2S1]QIG94435.1 hypothetical protein G6P99_19470 [Bradyrhizobium sp. 6(2017)]UGY16897.1 hypothetical protein HAP48_0005175 [Bradyrhizobium septentrionale]UGY25663.1 hypothetical protein HU675_0002000 [Bradyrhizobium septentrionale]
MRTNYNNAYGQSVDQQRDALAGTSGADTTAFTAALAAEGPASFAVDKRTGESVRLHRVSSNIGNAQSVSLFSDANERNKVGSMTVAPGRDNLRILTIENVGRSRYKGVGTAMIAVADHIRESAGLSTLSLLSQDEGASEFFYKKGFRFTDEDKNAEMRTLISNPRYAPDEILMGEMER